VALTTSAFIYGGSPAGLSLVDGLIVTFLTNILTLGASNDLLTLLQGKTTLKLAVSLHIVICAAYGLTVWTHVDTYGATPGCNLNSSVKFVVVGYSIGATSRGLRGFSIFCFASLAATLPFTLILLWFWKKLRGVIVDDDSDDASIFSLLQVFGAFFSSPWLWVVPLCGSWVYAVVTIEQIIQRNGVANASAPMTFGQTFALVLVLGPVLEFGSAVRRAFKGR